jgi:hypothetical protein
MHAKVFAAAALLAVLSGAPTIALAQTSSTAPAPGSPGIQAVDPAPNAAGPYLHDGEHDFYHPMVRERALQERIDAALDSGRLTPDQARTATNGLAQVAEEAKIQIARHGTLRDWDRERMNDMMNDLVHRYPALKS